MSVREEITFVAVCDYPRHEPQDEEPNGPTAEVAIGYAIYAWGWTTDGEGKIHCEQCPPLVLTEAAAAEQARRPTPGDVPLEGFEGTGA